MTYNDDDFEHKFERNLLCLLMRRAMTYFYIFCAASVFSLSNTLLPCFGSYVPWISATVLGCFSRITKNMCERFSSVSRFTKLAGVIKE